MKKSHVENTVGPWARQKLNGLEAYLNAYTTALKKQRFELVFIDAFAGAGRSKIRDAWDGPDEEDVLLLDDDFIAAEEQFIEGSPRRALGLQQPFDRHFFFDADAGRAQLLNDLKTEYPERQIDVRVGDANRLIQDLAPSLDRRIIRGVAFLDPYGPHLEWQTIEALGRTGKFEVIINFPLGRAINRLIILAAQAQKHVTHNEGLRILDGLVQLSVLDRDLTAPPGSPVDGDRYIVGSGATGDWAGWDLNVALWTDGAWLRLPPRTGWRAWVEDEGLLLVYDGSGWVGTTPATLQNLALLGLGTTADASNPFSAKLNAALWTAKTVAEGGTGDLFYTMNKEATGDDLGLTLQTGFVTKALVGLFGSDRLRLAVSADGSTFFDGLSVDNATGIVDQPRLPRFKVYTNYDNYVGVGTWTKIGINNTDYNDQGAFDAANNHFVAPVDGTYLFGAMLLYKVNASTSARMSGRLVLNGVTEIRGSYGEVSGAHVSEATALWLQTMVPLAAGDTVELQGYFRVADGYFAADHTSFWGMKVG